MPVPRERDAVQRHLLRETAYETLCEAIVSGTLAPGETLHDNELCSWLGLSRTPVRGALVRLQEEGLVECAPQRFTRVTPVEVRDARSLFPVLATVHALATELAVPCSAPATTTGSAPRTTATARRWPPATRARPTRPTPASTASSSR